MVFGDHEDTVVIANGHGAPIEVWRGIFESLVTRASVIIWDYLTQHDSDLPARGTVVGIQSHCEILISSWHRKT